MAETKTLILRCKTKNGQHVLKSLTANNTIDDLRTEISETLGVNIGLFKILQGYPPKVINFTNGTTCLADVPIRTGDTLIVEDTKKVLPQANASCKPTQVLNYEHDNIEIPGILMRRIVPADNSCLFTSVHYVTTNGTLDATAGKNMRKIIADAVVADTNTYNEAFLGKPIDSYCEWIQNDETWGGGIELSILSKHFQLEIVAVDTQNIRLNRFGENYDYENRVLLIYDGIHYDPLHLEEFDGNSTVQTVIPCTDQIILQMALELGKEAQQSRQFTDVANFSLRCLTCNKPLKGQSEAQSHAKITGHSNFGEV